MIFINFNSYEGNNLGKVSRRRLMSRTHLEMCWLSVWRVKINFQWNISRNKTWTTGQEEEKNIRNKKSLTRVITWIIYNWQFCCCVLLVGSVPSSAVSSLQFSRRRCFFIIFFPSYTLISLLLDHYGGFIWYLWETEALTSELKDKRTRRSRRRSPAPRGSREVGHNSSAEPAAASLSSVVEAEKCELSSAVRWRPSISFRAEINDPISSFQAAIK